MCFIPETDIVKAKSLFDKARIKLQRVRWQCNDELMVTASCGMQSVDKGLSCIDIVGLADEKLYIAKKSGRNIVIDEKPPIHAHKEV